MAWQKQPDGSYLDDVTGNRAPAGTNPLSLGNTGPGSDAQTQAMMSGTMSNATPGDPTGANANPTMTGAPYTGFAGQYQPGQLTGIYDNPWYILQDVFKGVNPSSPGYQGLRDFGADPLALFNIMAGGSGTIAGGDTGAGAFANFMADLYKNMGTPGGKALNAQDLLGTIFGQDLDVGGTGEAKTTLGNLLLAGDMNQQVRTLFNLLRDVSSSTMNPLAASAYQAAAARAGDQYGNQMLKSTVGGAGDQSIMPWIKQNMPWLAVT